MDLDELRKLAGINEFKGYTEYAVENISVTGSEKRQIAREKGIEPGTEDWFKLWFSRPYWTGQPSFRGRKK